MMRVPGLFIVCCLMSLQGMSQLSTANEKLSQFLISTRADSSFQINSTFDMTADVPKTIMSKKKVTSIPAFSPRHYGFFCRIEESSPRRKGISPRFRLGSVSHVDYLEGKQISSPIPRNY